VSPSTDRVPAAGPGQTLCESNGHPSPGSLREPTSPRCAERGFKSATETAANAVRGGRIEVVDWLRGLAVFLMIMAHGMDAWLLPSAKSGFLYGLVKVGSGIPARLFLLLVGVSAAIQFEAGLAKGADPGVLRGRLAKRGLQVLVLAYLFRLQEWVLSHFYGGWEALFRIDILNAIGATMLVVALVAAPRRGRRQILPALVCAAVFLGLGPAIGPAHFPTWLPRPITSYIGGQRPMAWFPLFPWAAWALCGVALGHLWVWASRVENRARRCFLLSFFLGIALTSTVGLVRYLDPTIIRYPNEVVQQMGPGIFFHRLGLIAALSAIGFAWCRALKGRFSVLRQLGRTSLLIYWVHIEFCYGSFVFPLRGRFHLLGAALLVLSLTTLMLGLSLAKTQYFSIAAGRLRGRFRRPGLA
jgi:uncharacterized membrane protein